MNLNMIVFYIMISSFFCLQNFHLIEHVITYLLDSWYREICSVISIPSDLARYVLKDKVLRYSILDQVQFKPYKWLIE